MTDTKLLKIKALSFIRPAGRRRPKENHYNGITDYYAKNNKRKQPSLFKRNMVENEDQCGKKKKKKQSRCSECFILGQPRAGRRMWTWAPRFQIFSLLDDLAEFDFFIVFWNCLNELGYRLTLSVAAVNIWSISTSMATRNLYWNLCVILLIVDSVVSFCWFIS